MTQSIDLHSKNQSKMNIHNSPFDQFSKLKRTDSKLNDISKHLIT
jgi:hypothetical protein